MCTCVRSLTKDTFKHIHRNTVSNSQTPHTARTLINQRTNNKLCPMNKWNSTQPQEQACVVASAQSTDERHRQKDERKRLNARENPPRGCCCSVAKSCPILCDPVDWSTAVFSVLHYLPEFAQTHVRRLDDAIQPFHPLSPPSPPAFSLCRHQGLFQWVSSLHQVAKMRDYLYIKLKSRQN